MTRALSAVQVIMKPRVGRARRTRPARILIVGASGTIGSTLLRLLAAEGATIGAHYYQHKAVLEQTARACRLASSRVKLFGADVRGQRQCHALVDAFVEWAGGIDSLVQLSGDVRNPCAWEVLSESDWLADLNVNLSGPFFLVQRAMRHMREHGGRILLTSTASAKHGGGRTSMAYGVAKAGIECLTKACARDGAAHGILVNAIAPGFIESRFHAQRMRRTPEELARRATLVPLKRAGKPEDVARLIRYLLSPEAAYITGECIAVSGGDWL